MTSRISFFPVGNGDMTLIRLADSSGSTILIDCNIRDAADDPNDPTPDVAKELRRRIKVDSMNRPYVDVFLLSHPDQDHCNGLIEHFYLGSPTAYPDDRLPQAEKRILIRELWSSPVVFRRASRNHILCADARAFNAEARRRVKLNRDTGFAVGQGDRILVLGEDEDGKTDDLTPILVKTGQTFNRVNLVSSSTFSARLLAPLPVSAHGSDSELGKNHSSVILNMDIATDASGRTTKRFLSGGDAEVLIWELLWEIYGRQAEVLAYDLLQTPHHCSWHSLSWESWSDLHEDAEISEDARDALSQIRTSGVIVSSSDAIIDDDNDPPCYGARIEYEGIARGGSGRFYCTGEYPTSSAPAMLEFDVTATGLSLVTDQAPKNSLLKPAAVIAGLGFPAKPVMPKTPAGFA